MLAGIGLIVVGVVLAQPGVAVAIDVQSATVSPQAVTGGTAATGTVTLTGPAPGSGIVRLTSDLPTLMTRLRLFAARPRL